MPKAPRRVERCRCLKWSWFAIDAEQEDDVHTVLRGSIVFGYPSLRCIIRWSLIDDRPLLVTIGDAINHFAAGFHIISSKYEASYNHT